MKHKKLPIRILIAAIGLMISGIGVGIFIFSQLGVDPASVFQLGLAKQLGIRYGDASALMNLVILTIVFIIDRKFINISSFLAIFLIGYTADFTSTILMGILPSDFSVGIRMVLMIIGCGIMASGIPIYIRANLGVGAVDLISEIISDKSGVAYRMVRIIGDLTLVIVGYFLGGTAGVGTIVAVVMTGPIVQFLRPHTNKMVDRIIGEYDE
ncbi:membrane protein [Erysipelothrix sp. P66]|uniref:YczE/YyaS/YitT family protein n=1 Tax=Erysipelothrix sp. P66 TaxID=3141531 RepID=UPI00315D420B